MRHESAARLRLSLLAAAVLLTLSCERQDSKVEQDLRDLRSDMRKLEQMRYDVESLQKEVQALRGEKKTPAENAVMPATWKPDQSHKDDPFLGSDGAPAQMMIFTDYQCRPCRDFVRDTLPALKRDFVEQGKLKIILRDYPLASHAHAIGAAKLAHCAGEQGSYWKMHDALFSREEEVEEGKFLAVAEDVPGLDKDKMTRCLSGKKYEREAQADLDEGERLGIRGAPGFFVWQKAEGESFPGVLIRGAQPLSLIKKQIERFTPQQPAGDKSKDDLL